MCGAEVLDNRGGRGAKTYLTWGLLAPGKCVVEVQKRPETWCALAILVCFFLPWVSLGGLISIPGYRLPEVARGLAQLANTFNPDDTSSADASLWLNIVYVLPLLSLGVVAMAAANKRLALLGTIAGAAPLALFVFALMERGTGLFQILSVGAYFTLVAAIALITFAQGFVQLSSTATPPISRSEGLLSFGVCFSLLLVAMAAGVVARQQRVAAESAAATARLERERRLEEQQREQERALELQRQRLQELQDRMFQQQADLQDRMRQEQADLQRLMNR